LVTESELFVEQTRRRLAIAYHGGRARRDFLQHLIAGIMTEAAIDVLNRPRRGNTTLGSALGDQVALSKPTFHPR